MNVNYFGYYLQDFASNKQYQIDLTSLIESLVSPSMADFRQSITYNGDNIYPLTFQKPAYTLLQSRDNELIKSIIRSSLVTNDISQSLPKGASVGMASYLYMGDCWFGLASKVLSPRVNAVASAINQYLEYLHTLNPKSPKLTFMIWAFKEKSPPSDIYKLNHVSSMSIRFDASTNIGQDIIKTLKGDPYPLLSDLGDIEVTIKPAKRKSNLKTLLKDLSHNISHDEISELDARAKVDAADRMRDMYFMGAGGIRDTLSPCAEQEIPSQIAMKSKSNKALLNKIKEFKSDQNFIQVSDATHIGLAW